MMYCMSRASRIDLSLTFCLKLYESLLSSVVLVGADVRKRKRYVWYSFDFTQSLVNFNILHFPKNNQIIRGIFSNHKTVSIQIKLETSEDIFYHLKKRFCGDRVRLLSRSVMLENDKNTFLKYASIEAYQLLL
jgi:hypothetical protein